MHFMYHLGKILLVVALVFQVYSEINDIQQRQQFKKHVTNISKVAPKLVFLLTNARQVFYTLAGLRFSSAFLIFTNSPIFVFTTMLGIFGKTMLNSHLFEQNSQLKSQAILDTLNSWCVLGGLLMIVAFQAEKQKMKKMKEE